MSSKRRQSIKEAQRKQRDRTQLLLCIAGGLIVLLVSAIVCVLMMSVKPQHVQTASAVVTPMPFVVSEPFSLSDLTARQLETIRKQGRMSVSDGPRGISVGDSLDKLLSVFPETFDGEQSSVASNETGLRQSDEQILYCAAYVQNANGQYVALPPRGLIALDNGEIVVTLLTPTSAYPPGTLDNYRSYEHIYCVFSVDPDDMTVRSITLGLSS